MSLFKRKINFFLKTNRKKIIFLLLTFLQFVNLFSQNYNFSNYSVANGLIQSTINEITQDKFGYVWLATNGGLSRFNGKDFKNFTKENGLPSNKINCILEFENTLWIGTEKGLILYDGKSFKKINENSFLNTEAIVDLNIHDNKVMLCTDETINIIERKSVQTINAEDILINTRINCAINDKDNNIWIGTNGDGIIVLQEKVSTIFNAEFIKNNTNKKIKIENKDIGIINLNSEIGLLGNNIACIEKDLANNIWYGEWKIGLGKISFLENKEILFSDYSLDDKGDYLFKSPRIVDINCDKAGRIWLASDGYGIYKIIPKNKFYEYELTPSYIDNYFQNNGLPDNNPNCFFTDQENNMWVGTTVNGIVKFNNEQFLSYGRSNGLEEERVISMYADTVVDELWIGTYGGGIFHKKNEKFIRYFWGDGLSESIVTGIVKDKFNNIWAATNGGGISILPYENRSKIGNKFIYLSTKHGLPTEFVAAIEVDNNNNIWVGLKNGGGIVKVINNNADKNYEIKVMCPQEEILQSSIDKIFVDKKNRIWVSTRKGVVAIDTAGNIISRYEKDEFLKGKEVNTICQDAIGNIWLGCREDGLIILKNESKKSYITGVDPYKPEYLTINNGLSSNSIRGLISAGDFVIVSTILGFNKISFREAYSGIKSIKRFSKLDGFTMVECNENSLTVDGNNHIWIGTSKGLTAFITSNDSKNNTAPSLNIEKVLVDYNSIDSTSSENNEILFSGFSDWFKLPINLVLQYNKNNITFEYSGISTSSSEQVKYQYILEGIDKKWSPVTLDNKVTYRGLPPGSYIFKIKAGSAENIWSLKPATFSFEIKPPYYKTIKFYILSALAIIGLITIYIQLRIKKLRATKNYLENKVTERTFEVEKQKEEITEKSKIIELKNNDITAGIRYAERIQKAILPDEKILLKYFSEHFILFKPRDIVSGDFYWMAEKENKVYVAAIDCTGHGVSGAFMSLISYSLMNEALALSNGKNDQILTMLRTNLHKALKQNDPDALISDGLDIALISYCKLTNELNFSNSNRPLYIVRNNELIIIDSTRSIIGGNYQSLDEHFKTDTLTTQTGDKLFLFTDGYSDQFGGEKMKKFGKQNFQKLILEASKYNMAIALQKVDENLTLWKNNSEQIDDILLIGLSI
jgi:ligand-binding sensor domain-containing protein/serine phosphatase RsbU (regulator of sigma subunit)